jgi:transcription elongation factor GreA
VNEIVLTHDGYEKLKQEIEYLSGEKRREIADRIRIAREFGDISENAEYDDAKHEQALLEHRISMLQERLRQARVLDASEVSSDVVSIGTRVQLEDVDAGETIEYHIVGSAEADPAANKLSNESPVGKALVGRKKGDNVTVLLPSGKQRELTVTKIEVA